MSRVVEIRNKLKPEFQKQYGVNPTYLIFVARAVVEVLKKYPWINGEIRGEQIVTRPNINLGFAVERLPGWQRPDRPGRQHAEPELARCNGEAVTDIAERARNKKLTPEEVQGGTFGDQQPRRLRHVPRDADHQPAPGGDPRHLRARQAPGSSRTCSART